MRGKEAPQEGEKMDFNKLMQDLAKLDRINKELAEIEAGTHEETNRRIEELRQAIRQKDAEQERRAHDSIRSIAGHRQRADH